MECGDLSPLWTGAERGWTTTRGCRPDIVVDLDFGQGGSAASQSGDKSAHSTA